MIKNESYIVVQGWMINKLKLNGSELLIYALIYGFSQDGFSTFNGSLKYVGEFLNIDRSTVQRKINALCKKGYILKETVKVADHLTHCRYKANLSILNIEGIGKMPMGHRQNATEGIGKMPTNNNINKTTYISKKAQEYNSFPQNKYDFGALEEEFLANK